MYDILFCWDCFAVVLLVVFLWYIYFGYLGMLKLMLMSSNGTSKEQRYHTGDKITVLLTVYNEEKTVLKRVENVLAQNYPSELIEVLVASDGSTDSTNEIVSSIDDSRVRLYMSNGGNGKTETQNAAITSATGSILVFTDAESWFDDDYLLNISSVFYNENVGAADGRLMFRFSANCDISISQGYYWNYELSLRDYESRLGILAVASGACLAVRKELVRKMDPSIGEDCIVPLDVVEQGYKVVHVKDAITYDNMGNGTSSEFKSRVRMTQRNWSCTWSRRALLNPFKNPGYAFSLWSHKLLRWLSPFFLLSLSVYAIQGLQSDVIFMNVFSFSLIAFYCAAILGGISEWRQWKLPYIYHAYSFMLSNIGFFVGVIKAVSGVKVYRYR